MDFGQRNTPIYTISLVIEKVKHRYLFLLNTITCLKQNKWTPEQLFAEVEFNYNPNNVNTQPTNRYWLGHFQNHESSSAFSTHHFSFSSVSSFSIKFYVYNYLINNTLLDEWTFEIVPNEKNASLLMNRMANDTCIKFDSSNELKTQSLTLSKAGHIYNLEFTVTKETIPGISKEVVVATPEYTMDRIVSTKTFNSFYNAQFEVLIDGLQTFSRYYHYMMQATHSIDITGWELSLSFGLVYQRLNTPKNQSVLDKLQGKFNNGSWRTLQDVLLEKASKGVKIRLMVWRHQFLSWITRFLYLGEVTIEREAQKLQIKAAKMGLKVKIFHTEFNLPNPNSKYANPYEKWNDADIIVVLVGNPKGIVSCHHEKLVLIDAHHPDRCVAFTGGFDIARGRFDTPSHTPPEQSSLLGFFNKEEPQPNFRGRAPQPFWSNISWLWHDIQTMVKGPATRSLHLHFVQRWVHAFTSDNHRVRELQLPNFTGGTPMIDPPDSNIRTVPLQIIRAWPVVLEKHVLMENFCEIINNAKDYLYFEHQYPFQNFILTQCMCDALKRNQNLKVIMIIPIKTDLPTGVLGNILDISQDHINEHLEIIYKTAPERVGIYGLVRQETKSKALKTIYIHSKLCICDDKIMCVGSSNMDNLSFYQSSEINVNVFDEKICKETLQRLAEEHLDIFFKPQVMKDFKTLLASFENVAKLNHDSLISDGSLVGRVVHLVPESKLKFISNLVNYPSPIAKMVYKLGWNYQIVGRTVINNLQDSTDPNVNSFFLQSML